MRRDVFQAIADPTRQAVSKHIRILVECDLLEEEQHGREIQYQLRAGKMREIEKWLEQFKALMAKRFDQLDDVLTRLKEKKK
jgi:DNA-binding transcriptional ArsR family regulator